MTRPYSNAIHKSTIARRAQILAFVRAHEPVTYDVVREANGDSRVRDDVAGMVARGELYSTRHDGGLLLATRRELLPALPRTDSPGLIDGHGERRDDCRRYADCLDIFVRIRAKYRDNHGYSVDPPAQCRENCGHFMPIPRHSEIEMYGGRTSSMGAAEDHAPGDIGGLRGRKTEASND